MTIASHDTEPHQPGTPGQITIHKSLGHAVQDLAATACLYGRATSEGPIA